MAAPKGHKRYGGRRPGSINKVTADVKAALVKAFDELGGVPSLVKWAKKAPTEFYKLWAKMLPTEIKADVGGKVRVHITEVVVDGVGEPSANGTAPH